MVKKKMLRIQKSDKFSSKHPTFFRIARGNKVILAPKRLYKVKKSLRGK